MSLIVDNVNNLIRIDVPNSEAKCIAQHNGIKDREVGAYYMSENYIECFNFLFELKGEYYIDLPLSIMNARTILLDLKKYKTSFKFELSPQERHIEALNSLLCNHENYFYQIKAPSINEQKKYLKLDNENPIVESFRSLIIGDLTSIFIKKFGSSGFLIYLDKSPLFHNKINDNTVLNWAKLQCK